MPVLLYADNFGRLGNRLIVHSHLIAFCERHDCTLINLGLTLYSEFFAGTEGALVSCRYPEPSSRWVKPLPAKVKALFRRYVCRGVIKGFRLLYRKGLLPRRLALHMGRDHARIADNREDLVERLRSGSRAQLLFGWSFRDPASLVRSAPRIRRYFRLVEPHATRVRELVEHLRTKGRVVVGVHLRRGDYATFKGGRYLYASEVYERVIRDLADQLREQQPVFVITSDDLAAAAGLEARCAPLTMVARSGHLVEDLYLLAACDYIVGPPSTYSKWASFVGERPMLHLRHADEDVTLARFAVVRDLAP